MLARNASEEASVMQTRYPSASTGAPLSEDMIATAQNTQYRRPQERSSLPSQARANTVKSIYPAHIPTIGTAVLAKGGASKSLQQKDLQSASTHCTSGSPQLSLEHDSRIMLDSTLEVRDALQGREIHNLQSAEEQALQDLKQADDTLAAGGMVNDKVIDIILRTFFSTKSFMVLRPYIVAAEAKDFVVEYPSVQTESIVYLPIHGLERWALALFDLEERQIRYFGANDDACSMQVEEHLSILAQKLCKDTQTQGWGFPVISEVSTIKIPLP